MVDVPAVPATVTLMPSAVPPEVSRARVRSVVERLVYPRTLKVDGFRVLRITALIRVIKGEVWIAARTGSHRVVAWARNTDTDAVRNMRRRCRRHRENNKTQQQHPSHHLHWSL